VRKTTHRKRDGAKSEIIKQTKEKHVGANRLFETYRNLR
jgi:hypothetical protein